MADLLAELDARELLADCTDLNGLCTRLAEGSLGAYCGFDPTADSLHVGSLTPLAVLALMRRHGHRPLLLIGGATGMIGDPSGRSAERTMLGSDTLDQNRAGLRAQMLRLLPDAELVDNRDWFERMSAIEFMRSVGTRARVSEMLTRSSMKARTQSAEGLSFTELAYQLMQAYDFWHLHERLGCELQLGGTDQWGNITAGVDYMRRVDGRHGFGLVWPLLVKDDGEKFGKTAEGNVWLAAERTSPFRFHQFWLQSDDDLVRTLLLRFTARSLEEINRLHAEHVRRPERRLAQRALASDLTRWVHGEDSAATAEEAAELLFAGPASALRPATLSMLEAEIGALRISREEAKGLRLDQLAARSGLCSSISDARRQIAAGGVYVNGTRAIDPAPPNGGWDLDVGWFLLRRGRRSHALVRLL